MEKSERIADRLINLTSTKTYPFVIIDAGARGALPEPWVLMNEDCLRVHGFEPDPEAFAALEKKHAYNRLYHPFALWNENKQIILNLNASRATSAIYPTNNDVLAPFPEKHTASRQTEKMIEVMANRIDNLVQEAWIDHIKVDVHSAEMEVLEGAENTLKNVFSVLIETWCLEVHKGQRLLGDVLTYMDKAGFEPYTFENEYMAWHEAQPSELKSTGRRRQVASVVLFVRKDFTSVPREHRIKAASILDIYGYPEAALRMLVDLDGASEAKNVLLRTWNNRPKLRGPIMRRIFGQKQDLYRAPLS